MRNLGLIAASAALLAGCGGSGPGPAPGNESEAAAAPAAAGGTSEPRRWDLQSSGEGAALVLAGTDRPEIRLTCTAGGKSLRVNVSGFRPVGSEERLSFGSGGASAALVADSRGDSRLGGVSASGAVPDDLAALIAGPVSATYGAQRSGPHAAMPRALAEAFVAACRKGAAPPAPRKAGATASASPCLTQDGKTLSVAAVRAFGTEPFWNARVEGRCVTYSHPEDQKGSRVWTRFTPAPGGGTWAGSLGGRSFELKVRPKRGCSDGMSDKSYALAADLVVAGERRSGCAEPL
ncbi:MAG: hypothetical protein QOJ91_796 [Sphingomonadales bacterium]|nr:hypothetical protein [Sphingomonadales bacterium]